mmetsp:Transcript_35137/g.67150  ORF Transcript_35137/g.67150 Transcript_35137/m.67150 type:complete len:246 (+) Transcript_35137:205-942(+)
MHNSVVILNPVMFADLHVMLSFCTSRMDGKILEADLVAACDLLREAPIGSACLTPILMGYDQDELQTPGAALPSPCSQGGLANSLVVVPRCAPPSTQEVGQGAEQVVAHSHVHIHGCRGLGWGCLETNSQKIRCCDSCTSWASGDGSASHLGVWVVPRLHLPLGSGWGFYCYCSGYLTRSSGYGCRFDSLSSRYNTCYGFDRDGCGLASCSCCGAGYHWIACACCGCCLRSGPADNALALRPRHH